MLVLPVSLAQARPRFSLTVILQTLTAVTEAMLPLTRAMVPSMASRRSLSSRASWVLLKLARCQLTRV